MGAFKGSKTVSYFEWQTVLLIAACYSFWFVLILAGETMSLWFLIPLLAITTTLHLSIVHEVVHGHPTSSPVLNQLLVSLPISWIFPFERFRDTHLQHHETGELTDPLDDPESWYVYTKEWVNFGYPLKLVLTFNNTLAGRMLIGPTITLLRFYASEVATFASKPWMRTYMLRVWGIHFLLCSLLILLITRYGSHPGWVYALSAYAGLSILLIRTFLEHQAAEDHSERTVIIEMSCPIAFLFLFNNLHALHHEKPGIAWYRLPATYKAMRTELLARNKYYVYSSYAEIFRRYFFRPKEPVEFPLEAKSLRPSVKLVKAGHS
ncbi:MAG: fatty acid desaturase [Pseudomonadota bacterium]